MPVKNTMASAESLTLIEIHYNTSLKDIYQDVQLHGLSNTTRSSSESEEEKSIQHAVRYLEERFFQQGNNERTTTVSYTSAWPTGSTLEDFNVNKILTLA
jgi:hypothetical protein